LWAWDAIFYGLLVLALVLSLRSMGFYGAPQAAAVALSVAWGGWYWFMLVGHRRWVERTWPMLLYAAVAAVLFFGLVRVHPVFNLLAFALYLQIYVSLPVRRAIPVSAVLAALLVVRGVVWEDGNPVSLLLSSVFTVGIGAFFALFIDSIIDQSEERHRLIGELEATRQELAAAEREAGVLEERGRLAREIHDTLAQGFVSIVAHLEAAEETMDPGNGTALRHLDQARATARENLIEARRLVAALRPEILEGSSLPEALERLIVRWSESSGIRAATLTVTGEEHPLLQEEQVALLRTTQEALQNVRRHAGASSVAVTLSRMDDLVALDVQDDGRGFAPEGVTVGVDRGFGLRAMRERIEALGGSLLIESEPGEGCTLAVELPVGRVGEAVRSAGVEGEAR
jgi:signal transduction histidine kinase